MPAAGQFGFQQRYSRHNTQARSPPVRRSRAGRAALRKSRAGCVLRSCRRHRLSTLHCPLRWSAISSRSHSRRNLLASAAPGIAGSALDSTGPLASWRIAAGTSRETSSGASAMEAMRDRSRSASPDLGRRRSSPRSGGPDELRGQPLDRAEQPPAPRLVAAQDAPAARPCCSLRSAWTSPLCRRSRPPCAPRRTIGLSQRCSCASTWRAARRPRRSSSSRYAIFRLSEIAARQARSGALATALNVAWITVVLYSWVSPLLFRRMLAKELESVRLSPRF